MGLGNVYLKQKRTEKAIDMYKNVLTLLEPNDPRVGRVHFNLALAMASEYNYTGALEHGKLASNCMQDEPELTKLLRALKQMIQG
mmetsp:Transcript_41026/g.66006  ORF Transcript_41026/g.66006 Transcript_41026/m.66006 type:complete len:85 (-) Transcript_41026:1206-1460(-)